MFHLNDKFTRAKGQQLILCYQPKQHHAASSNLRCRLRKNMNTNLLIVALLFHVFLFLDLYFFEGTNAYRFHSINMSASEAISIAHLWNYCPETPKSLSCNQANPVVIFTAIILPFSIYFCSN